MKIEKSQNHICFRDSYEYFWVTEITGRKFVVRAHVDNHFDITTKQRVGARFEGTEAWFQRFGSELREAASQA